MFVQKPDQQIIIVFAIIFTEESMTLFVPDQRLIGFIGLIQCANQEFRVFNRCSIIVFTMDNQYRGL